MKKLTDRVFARFGIEARLNGQQRLKVLFWSVNRKSWQNMQLRYGILGQIPGGQYVCLFPGGTTVKCGDYVTVKEQDYLLCRVEDYLDAKGTVCRWALCTVKGGENTWM
ncbi:MAG: hypothetical protein IKY59_04000 [Oscillospiraceae bacterium]|nr:hypothetical protein [Oscillospiraceae bacterium]